MKTCGFSLIRNMMNVTRTRAPEKICPPRSASKSYTAIGRCSRPWTRRTLYHYGTRRCDVRRGISRRPCTARRRDGRRGVTARGASEKKSGSIRRRLSTGLPETKRGRTCTHIVIGGGMNMHTRCTIPLRPATRGLYIITDTVGSFDPAEA